MRLRLEQGLLFVSVSVTYLGKSLVLDNVILDTGSAGTVLAIDKVSTIDLLPEPGDSILEISGVGGTEYAFSKQIDSLKLEELVVNDFSVEIGAMLYSIQLDGIVGLDFLIRTKAVVDLDRMEVYASADSRF